jgi:hypothetical protein
MALDIENSYPSNSNPADSAYPQGSIKDETVPGSSSDGTPIEAQIFNDWLGFFQRLLLEANTVPSGSADTVLASDYFDSLQKIKPTDSASAKPTVAGKNVYYFTDRDAGAPFGVSSTLTTGVIASIGGTGAGKDHEWSALDEVPSDAVALILEYDVLLANLTPALGIKSASVRTRVDKGDSGQELWPININRQGTLGSTGPIVVDVNPDKITPIAPDKSFAVQFNATAATWPDELSIAINLRGYVR